MIEWNEIFLEAIMKKMDFVEKWVGLIVACVRSVNYSILINGQPNGKILSTRGIRQDDPIFPYLFILCAEELFSLIHRVEESNVLSGIPIT